MRELRDPPPGAIFDAATGRPRTGSFVGGLPPVDWTPLGLGPVARLVRRKTWVYVGLATRDVYAAVAIVRLGYASHAFAYAYDAEARRLLFRRSWMATPLAARIGEGAGEGCRATFRGRAASISVARPPRSSSYGVTLEAPNVSLSASLDAEGAPPAVGAVAEIAPGRFDATEKRALLAVKGDLRVAGRAISLDGGLGAYDFTSGVLPRRTLWRWALALGWTADGVPFGLNLVEGFVGEAECAAWIGGEVLGLREGRFAFDRARPGAPWRVATADGVADMTMTPGTVHEEKRDLFVVASRFVQPCGAWSGALAIPGRAPVVVGRALGVTEDQDVVW
jgi:hypothetical protein